jgi:hypothetical protein
MLSSLGESECTAAMLNVSRARAKINYQYQIGRERVLASCPLRYATLRYYIVSTNHSSSVLVLRYAGLVSSVKHCLVKAAQRSTELLIRLAAMYNSSSSRASFSADIYSVLSIDRMIHCGRNHSLSALCFSVWATETREELPYQWV